MLSLAPTTSDVTTFWSSLSARAPELFHFYVSLVWGVKGWTLGYRQSATTIYQEDFTHSSIRLVIRQLHTSFLFTSIPLHLSPRCKVLLANLVFFDFARQTNPPHILVALTELREPYRKASFHFIITRLTIAYDCECFSCWVKMWPPTRHIIWRISSPWYKTTLLSKSISQIFNPLS